MTSYLNVADFKEKEVDSMSVTSDSDDDNDAPTQPVATPSQALVDFEADSDNSPAPALADLHRERMERMKNKNMDKKDELHKKDESPGTKINMTMPVRPPPTPASENKDKKDQNKDKKDKKDEDEELDEILKTIDDASDSDEATDRALDGTAFIDTIIRALENDDDESFFLFPKDNKDKERDRNAGLLQREELHEKVLEAVGNKAIFGADMNSPVAEDLKNAFLKNIKVDKKQLWQIATSLTRAINIHYPERANGHLALARTKKGKLGTLKTTTAKKMSADIAVQVLAGGIEAQQVQQAKPQLKRALKDTSAKNDTSAKKPRKDKQEDKQENKVMVNDKVTVDDLKQQRKRARQQRSDNEDARKRRPKALPRAVSDNLLAAAISACHDNDPTLLAAIYRELPSQLFAGTALATLAPINADNFKYGKYDTPEHAATRSIILDRARQVKELMEQQAFFPEATGRLTDSAAKLLIDDINQFELQDTYAMRAIQQRKKTRAQARNKGKDMKNKNKNKNRNASLLDKFIQTLPKDKQQAFEQTKARAAESYAMPEEKIMYTPIARDLLNRAFGAVIKREFRLARKVARHTNRHTVTGLDSIVVSRVQRKEDAASMPAPDKASIHALHEAFAARKEFKQVASDMHKTIKQANFKANA